MRDLLIMADFSPDSIEQIKAAAGSVFHVEVLPSDAEPMMRYAGFRTAEVIIGEPLAEELELAPQLKWLQITWAGTDRYTQASSFPSDITLTNASGAFGVTISEHAISGMLSLCRHLPVYRSYQQRGVAHVAAREKLLYGGTAVIFGAGDIGTEIARRLRAFNMRTIGICRTPRAVSPDFDETRTLAEADAVLPKADVVICCLPNTPETRGYFDRERLLKIKSDAILVNVGRGNLIHTEDLAEVMQEGHLFGAALDVTDPEPLPKGHPLRKMRNVVLTPHVAGLSLGGAEATEQMIVGICCDNLRRYIGGEPLCNQVDLQLGYRKR